MEFSQRFDNRSQLEKVPLTNFQFCWSLFLQFFTWLRYYCGASDVHVPPCLLLESISFCPSLLRRERLWVALTVREIYRFRNTIQYNTVSRHVKVYVSSITMLAALNDCYDYSHLQVDLAVGFTYSQGTSNGLCTSHLLHQPVSLLF